MDYNNKRTGLEKRSACDLCHIKKIKCDNNKPKCSHCIVYKTECKYTPHIQKRRRKENKVQTRPKPLSSIEGRLARMEEKLQTLPRPEDPTSGSPPFDLALSVEKYPLPPLQDVLPMVEDYFTNFNSLMPIFLRSSFMRMLHQWYSPSGSHDPASWAAINVVLALSLQNCSRSRQVYLDKVNQHVNNAQSVLTSLLMRDQDLRAIQVLLGLAVLFLNTPVPRPASILLSTAVKLVHRFQLHTKFTHKSISADISLERGFVFWSTYILDKDINMRIHEPYLLQDKDIDVEIPDYFDANDTAGALTTPFWFNFLETRIHLARYQGSVYDCTYSAQAARLSMFERQINTQNLHQNLESWRRSIPEVLQPDNFVDAVPSSAIRHFLLLYFTYFRALYMAHRVYAHDAEWIVRLVNYSQLHVVEFNQGNDKSEPVLCSDWQKMVHASRTCMRLFRIVDQSDSTLLWSTTCTYTTALIILVANNLTIQEHHLCDQFNEDKRLINEGLCFLEDLSLLMNDESLPQLHVACAELDRRATMAVANFQSNQPWVIEPGVPFNMGLLSDTDEISSFSALDLIRAFAGTDIKPQTRTIAWMRGLRDLVF